MALLEFKDYPNTTTPLNAANLNNNFNELKRNVCTAVTNGRPVISVSTAYEIKRLPLDVATISGTKLTFNNSTDEIEIGTGITKVLVSGKLVIFTSPQYNDGAAHIIKNGTETTSANSQKLGTFTQYVLPPRLIEVTAGDKIAMTFNSGTTGNFTFISDAKQCYLTVEVIE